MDKAKTLIRELVLEVLFMVEEVVALAADPEEILFMVVGVVLMDALQDSQNMEDEVVELLKRVKYLVVGVDM
ncbi:hypothetical protein [Bartonella taylorii]|uniref:hypothetical protein n=1 Tax=Bartonella taylorii TaxID=33046 RepID=UPI001ABBD3FB|nr:hypothetical protein [Bartonella taylorii]